MSKLTVESLLSDQLELADATTKQLLAIIANQRDAIYDLVDILRSVPGIDETRLKAVFESLNNFVPVGIEG